MKTKVTNILEWSKKLLPLLILLLVFIILLKQCNLFNRVASIYQSCLPVFMGVIIALLFQPVIDRIHQKCSLKVSVIIVYVGFLLALLAFAIIIIPVLYEQIIDFSKVLPKWIARLEEFLKKYHIVYGNLDTMKQRYIQEGYIIVIDSAKNFFLTFTSYGISFITAFFISIDLDFWKRTAKKVIPNVQQFSNFYQTMSTIVYQYLVGTLLDLLFIMVSVGLVLIVAGFPNALLYSCILAFLNLFPYIGAIFGLLLIGAVGALSYDQFPLMTFLIIWSIQQIESNLIQPLIFNRTMKVRPILTFAFIFISEAFFGLVGVILSPIFAAIAQIGFRSWLHSKTNDSVGNWDDIWQDFDEAMKEEVER